MKQLGLIATLLGMLLAVASCGNQNTDSRTPTPGPVRVKDSSGGDAVAAQTLTLTGANALSGETLLVELGYASERPGSVAIRSCMTVLAPDFELGRLYCGKSKGTSAAFTAGMANQACDGVVLAKASAGFPEGIQVCTSEILVESFQFQPALVVTAK